MDDFSRTCCCGVVPLQEKCVVINGHSYILVLKILQGTDTNEAPPTSLPFVDFSGCKLLNLEGCRSVYTHFHAAVSEQYDYTGNLEPVMVAHSFTVLKQRDYIKGKEIGYIFTSVKVHRPVMLTLGSSASERNRSFGFTKA